MNKRTLKALKGSIRKWKKIVAGTGKDQGTKNCALCKAFIDMGCEGCPIKDRTGYDGCNLSPYDDWVEHLEDCHDRTVDDAYLSLEPECNACKELAQKELDFLISLLPKDKK